MEDRTGKVVEDLKGLYPGVNNGPTRILLDPTDKCNLSCKFCWQRGKTQDYSSELSDERLLKLVREAAELNVKEWIISGGGDPLARNITLRLMEKIKKYGMWGQIITNSLLLKEEDIIRLIKIKWDHIQISIDGANAKTHDLLRNLDSAFEKTKINLSFLKRYKKELKSNKPSIGFNTVICSENYKQVHKIIKIAHKYDAEQVWFEMIAPWSESAKQYILTDKQKIDLERYAKKAEKLAKKYRIFTNIRYYIDKDLKQQENEDLKSNSCSNLLSAFCLAPWFSIKIHPTGVVGPCCTFYRDEPVGNLHKESLKRIWGKNFETLRKAMLKNKPPQYCKECTKGQIAEMNDIKRRL
jgi:radical SAM protein with 4Fe4S-binding SPASM domain